MESVLTAILIIFSVIYWFWLIITILRAKKALDKQYIVQAKIPGYPLIRKIIKQYKSIKK
jgi:hypothetical protein